MYKYIKKIFSKKDKHIEDNYLVSLLFEVDTEANTSMLAKWTSSNIENAKLLAQLIFCLNHGLLEKQIINILSSNTTNILDDEFLSLTKIELQRLEDLTQQYISSPVISPTNFTKIYATK